MTSWASSQLNDTTYNLCLVLAPMAFWQKTKFVKEELSYSIAKRTTQY